MTVYNAMLNISVNKANVLNTDIEEDESSGGETEETTTATEPEASEDDVMLGDMVSEEPVTTKSYIKTNTTYDSTGNYVVSETDELGNTTSYTYDGNGNKESITDGKGNVVEYEYDDADNVTSISSGNASNSYTYDYLGNVSLITHNNFSYQFNYNQYNKLIETKVGSNQIVTNEYDSNYGNLTRTTYGNGDYIDYEYDLYDNITEISSNAGTIATYEYNKKGLISQIEDSESGETTHYYYDFYGVVQGRYIFSNDGRLSKSISHDEKGNTVEKTSVAGVSRTITSGTDDNGEEFVNCDGLQSTKKTDDFDRVTSINTSIDSAAPFITTYKYAGGSEENSTSNTVNRLENRYKGNSYAVYNYSYDNNGNITQVRLNGTLISKYTYDSLNQLYEEYDYSRGRYTKYTYDNGGNIKLALESYLNSSGTIGGVCGSKNYTYGDTVWKDKLTKYGSYNITYDEIGNPLNYRNGITFSWKNGRWLASTTLSDNTTVTYQYNASGMRTKKTVGSTATNYYYDSNNNLIGLKSGSNVAFFYYDADNSPVSMKYNNNMYYYVKNLQGDIVKILDSNGSAVASYKYDAWGTITGKTVTNTTIDTLSPFRYRGYVYDSDTGLYYLQSRYYDPTTSRFINEDVYCDTDKGSPLCTNMFSYCENNSINKIDIDGRDAILMIDKYGAYGFGHAAILIQSEKRWWYFSVSDKQKATGKMVIDFMCLGKKNVKKIKNINKAINRNHLIKKENKAKYTNKYYIKGNFEKSFLYCKKVSINPDKYNVFNNNCLIVASKALSKGTCSNKYYKRAIKLLCGMTIPNNAKNAFSYFVKTYKKYYKYSAIKKALINEPYYYFYNNYYYYD
ncbi:MAG: hypothetical protein MSH11_09230 [Ruminococcus sp.]|nr:hypothetical protein [Ruminococcus sp.]